MTDIQLNLTMGERQFLVEFLQSTLHDTRIEEHRTRSPRFREHIVEREHVVEGLLAKLGQPDR